MKRFLAIAACLIWTISAATAQVCRSTDDTAQFVPGEVLVKFKPGAQIQSVMALEHGARLHRFMSGAEHWRVPDAEAAVASLSRRADVEYAELNTLRHADNTPNDPFRTNQWYLAGIPGVDAYTAWDHTTGSATIVLADIDTGVDHLHPDLAANIFTNPGEIAGNGIDDDGNGYIDDTRGWDFYANDNDPMDENLHGTHTSGTMGAVGNNATGVAGMNWTVKILPMRFLGPCGNGSSADAALAHNYLTWMKQHGINVVASNNSYGCGASGCFSQTEKDAIDGAYAAGVLTIISAGNDGRDLDNGINVAYPCSYTSAGIVCVAASDQSDNRASFSNYGATTVDVAAPGVDIWSTAVLFYSYTKPINHYYGSLQGTSMACPMVTGIAGLVKAAHPMLTAAALKTYLQIGTDPLSQWSGKVVWGGRINARKAVCFNLGC